MTFWEDKSNKKFRKEFLYIALISHQGDFRVHLTPKVYVENDDFLEENENEKSLKKKKGFRYLYQQKKEIIKKEVEMIIFDPFYESKLINKQVEV